jgi:nitrate reductase gamma subunit
MNIPPRAHLTVRTLRKKKIFLALTVLIFAAMVQMAEAGWWIDIRKFYNSGHGENTCIDCHEDIAEQKLHPNPDHVNRSLNDFFDIESCLACHEEIQDNLEEGVHGEEQVDEPEKYRDCINCHDPHYPETKKPDKDTASTALSEELPSPPEDDLACLSCHQAIEKKDPKQAQKIAEFCFHCHAAEKAKDDQKKSGAPPLLDRLQYASTTHAKTDCTACHPKSAEYGHGSQPQGDCRQCHTPHEEKRVHDAHSGVTCQACHLDDVVPLKDSETKAVRWEKAAAKPGMVSTIHNMNAHDDDAACTRCHFKENRVGAASMILPPKSIVCMSCHGATFSVGDTTTIITLLVFLAGFFMAASLWLSGSVVGADTAGSIGKITTLLTSTVKTVFSTKFVQIIKALFYDVFLQRRLYKRSVKRWMIHSLIFIPFVIRSGWGIVGLFASTWLQDWPPAWAMVNKNHPATAFLYDLTGVMIAAGITMAFFRGKAAEADRKPGVPKQDRLALGLIGAIVLVGFLLEGMRIAMTGTPPGSGYAPIGFMISWLFSAMTGLTDVYGYVWYLHAILTGAFIAYLPFSQLMHIILAPVVLMMNAVSESEHK